MMTGTIGIKIANGDFYPILEENSTVKKRLVLTTVHDGQESVQIDLFRSVSKSIDDAQYMGSLLVKNIKPRSQGKASIEMIISSDENGHITAEACDLDAGADGEHQILRVSHKPADSLNEGSDFVDFNLESKPRDAADIYRKTELFREEKRRSPWLIMVFALIFVIIAIGLLWFFFYGDKDANPFFAGKPGYEETAPVTPPPPPAKVEPVEPPPPPPPPPPEPAPVVETAPVIQAPDTPPPARPQTAARKRPPAPVSSYKVPSVIPKNGVSYQIRWGDTLWDISAAFYRNPWLYPRIARYNNIRNPDLIIAGKTIKIPPKK